MMELPTDLTRRYRYKYVVAFAHGSWSHDYEIIGAKGGVNLHVTGPNRYDDRDHWTAGLELHSRAPLGAVSSPPSFDKCWLLNCPCWHEGTTSFAEEVLLPLFADGDHHRVFRRMIDWADEKLG